MPWKMPEFPVYPTEHNLGEMRWMSTSSGNTYVKTLDKNGGEQRGGKNYEFCIYRITAVDTARPEGD